MHNDLKIPSDHIPCRILLPALVWIAVLSILLFFVSISSAQEESGSTNHTVAETKPSNPVSAGKPTSDKPIDKPAESETPPPPATAEPVAKESAFTESEQWQKQVEELIDQIKMGEKSSEDADALYDELSKVLREKRKKLRQALRWARSPSDVVQEKGQPGIPKQADKTTLLEGPPQLGTVADLHATMVSLYRTRDTLLQEVTPGLRENVTGTGVAGMSKLRGEIEFMLLHLRFHAMAIPQLGPRLLDKLKAAPVPAFWNFLKILLALWAFYGWRKWAPGGLIKLRARILQITPRRRNSVLAARAIWYVERIRRPLEWIIIAWIFYNAIFVPSLEVIIHFCRIITEWILYGWFAVLLIHAFASRGVAGLSINRSKLQLRSLKLLATWLVLLGLGLELAETYTGQGTIYANLWLLFEILSVPVFILLLAFWRSEIFRNLEDLAVVPEWVEKALQKRKGLRGYVNALVGGFYLLTHHIRQLSLRQLAKFEGGREILAGLLGREVARDDERQKQTVIGEPIGEQLKERLLASDGKILEKVSGNELNRIAKRVEFGRGGILAVVGERGSGKSLFLRRLANKFQDNAVIIQCSLKGFDDIKKAFARRFDITEDPVSPDRLTEIITSRNLRFIAFDDAHRLVRPKMGGQAELDRLEEFTLQVKPSITWIVAMDKHAYQYVKRVQSDRAMVEDLIELPAWTQEQISELIAYRCLKAGLTPDFSKLVIPYLFDETDYDTSEARNRSGFYRILWNAAGGNPSVALRLWADALAVTADDRILVRHLPRELSTGQLEGANLSVLLLLRVIAQSEISTTNDISESLQLPSAVVSNAIRAAMIRGWIEELDGYYRITWPWFKTITRVLARQNLLAREFFQETHS